MAFQVLEWVAIVREVYVARTCSSGTGGNFQPIGKPFVVFWEVEVSFQPFKDYSGLASPCNGGP